jgi:hypothetical protein
MVQYLPVETLKEARNLASRFQEGEAFRLYVLRRILLVIPAGLLCLLISVACAVASVVFLAQARSSLLALLAVVLAPFILIGSLLVQIYVFFSWLENRALARTYGHRTKPAPGTIAAWLWKKLRVDLGKAPPVPWAMAAMFLFAPLTMLALVALKVALILIALATLAPLLYARFDR